MLISIQLDNYVFLLECLFNKTVKGIRNNILEKHCYVVICILATYAINIIVFTESTRHGECNSRHALNL